MLYKLAADAVVVLHFGFVAFALAGGLLLLKWRRAVLLHLPAVAWAVLLELGGWTCPLTPLEIWLREAGGQAGYSGGFVQHYILPLLYPTELDRSSQIAIGIFVLAVNGVIYGWVFRRMRKRRGTG